MIFDNPEKFMQAIHSKNSFAAGDPFDSMVGSEGVADIMTIMVEGWKSELRKERDGSSIIFDDDRPKFDRPFIHDDDVPFAGSEFTIAEHMKRSRFFRKTNQQ